MQCSTGGNGAHVSRERVGFVYKDVNKNFILNSVKIIYLLGQFGADSRIKDMFQIVGKTSSS